MNSDCGSGSHGINVYGRQGGNSHLKLYNGRKYSVCNVLTDGNLDVGVGASQTSIKAYVNHEGFTGFIEIDARWRNQAFLSFDTTFCNGFIFLEAKNDYYTYCGNNVVHFYKTTPNVSDDRFKENE